MAEGRLFVNTKDESPRLFDSNFLDFFSRIPFWVPIIIYVPAVVFFPGCHLKPVLSGTHILG